MIKNKDGFAIFVFIPIIFIMFFMAAMVIDWGRAMVGRGHLQTISDSAALAGASTAEVEKEIQYREVNGEMILVEKIIGLKIDTVKAYEMAYSAAELNGGTNDYWESIGGSWGEMEGQVIGNDNYEVNSTAYLKLTFLRPIYKELFGQEDMQISMPGFSRALLIQRDERGESE